MEAPSEPMHLCRCVCLSLQIDLGPTPIGDRRVLYDRVLQRGDAEEHKKYSRVQLAVPIRKQILINITYNMHNMSKRKRSYGSFNSTRTGWEQVR